MWAAVFAGLITVVYLRVKTHINNERQLSTSEYIKPASLIGILVFFIVMHGSGSKETISTEPF